MTAELACLQSEDSPALNSSHVFALVLGVELRATDRKGGNTTGRETSSSSQASYPYPSLESENSARERFLSVAYKVGWGSALLTYPFY